MDLLKEYLLKLHIEVLKNCIIDLGYIIEPEKNKKIIALGPVTVYHKKQTESIPSTNTTKMYYKPVPMSDKRFDEIYDKILVSYPNSCVLYINEVINETLENAFMRRFGILSNITENAKILQLFHGTANNIIDIIAQNGFDPTFNKTAAFGYGTYFAKEANYSKDYMKSTEDITYMFLADVIVGRLVTGRKRIQGGNPVYDWDNNVDNISNPKIYTTPYADGAYPRYIVAFHKNAR
jgi:hypothetical protein